MAVAPGPEALFLVYPGLPGLKKATFQPPLFEDSTHRLWHCDTEAGDMMLKLCQSQNLADSPCWRVIEQLFGLHLPEQLGTMSDVRRLLLKQGCLPIPEVIACSKQTEQWPGFMLSSFVSGKRLSAEQVSDAMIVQLARQMASLHRYTSARWGRLLAPAFEVAEWPRQLAVTLQAQAADPHWLNQALAQLELNSPTEFCPIMLDNRWDQYLYNADNITALVDIDAFVTGPAELELVLLEYQLDTAQAAQFRRAYQTIRPMPELSPVRLAYRLLLFSMNALGESDLTKWMRAPITW